MLSSHPDKHYVNTLAKIIDLGAKIGYRGPKQLTLNNNLPSVSEAPKALLADLQEQHRLGRLTRLNTLPRWFISSPLGVVPKGDGRWRRIHHLSYPRGESVNCHIPEAWGALEYATFNDAVEALLTQGRGCHMVKKDLADAFRHVPVATSDHWLLGFQYDGSY